MNQQPLDTAPGTFDAAFNAMNDNAGDSAQTLVEQAVLIALPHHTLLRDASGNAERFATSAMMPLVDRPIVQHAIERLSAGGVRRLHVLGLPDVALRQFVCDDHRWGMEISWINARHGLDCEPLRTIACGTRLVIGFTHAVPFHSFSVPRLHEGVVTLLGQREGSRWAVVDGQTLQMLPAECDYSQFAQWLRDLCEVEVAAHNIYETGTLDALLQSQRRLLESSSSDMDAAENECGVRLIGRVNPPGVRCCRNVKIHPSATLHGPVFLGDNVRIGRRVTIEPNTVIGADCVVDHDAVIGNSIIESNSYVGPWVEVRDCYVDQTHVANVRLHALVEVDDALVLGST